jgi:sulfur relay protein TusB/DsrH
MKYLIWLSSDCTNLDETISALKKQSGEIGILLIQDGVFMADKGCEEGKNLSSHGIDTFVSRKHAEERGLLNRLNDSVSVVDYPEIVDLIMLKYDRVISI